MSYLLILILTVAGVVPATIYKNRQFMAKPNFQAALKEAQEAWMNIEGVVSVAHGKKNQQDCIDVYIAVETAAVKEQIPEVYKTIPVVIRNSGGPFVSQ